MGVTLVINRRRAVLALSACLALAACHTDDPCGPKQRPCKLEGRCTLDGKSCVATDDAVCKSSEDCGNEGRCRLRAGRCVAVDIEDCEASSACKRSGRCSVDGDGYCIVATLRDCERLDKCARGRCKLNGGTCEVIPERYGPDNKEGGCPCGCDHSEEMASELARSETGVAEASIQAALTTIAEREDAGYITWAMITHRRRLLASSQTLLGKTPGGRGVPLPTTPMLPANAMRVDGDGLTVRAELLVHGETTEKIAGEDKTIRASFRLGLEISNSSSQRRALSRPTLSGDAGFPVSTWYVLGSDGAPWDGMLEPNQTRRVNVIGYLDEPLAPGSLAAAKVSFEGLTFHIQSVAGAHWR